MGKNTTINEPANALWDLLWEIGDHMTSMASQLESIARESEPRNADRGLGHPGELMHCGGKLMGLAICLKAAAGQQAGFRHGQ